MKNNSLLEGDNIANNKPNNYSPLWTDKDIKLKKESKGGPVIMSFLDYRETKTSKIAQLKRGWEARKKKDEKVIGVEEL